MTMKKDDRKNEYMRIMKLMLEGKNKQAFDGLACMCGEDTGLFWLVNYDEASAALDSKAAASGASAE